MTEPEDEGETGNANKGTTNYPLVNYSDMNEEMITEVSEMCVTACEKYPNDNCAAAKMVKRQFEQKAGVGWQVVIGQGFGFEITYDLNSVMLLYVGGNTGVLIWKCA
ncbi:Dynein light chain 4, axonemal [Echinococcus granulosus]|uniref:Dynein axonemal light chain 4 n=1 Tax=Echinococcus granulosus TaxID=6210 RepID=A0A068WSE4_ECHGR|nr:Dynein light chain 4, axonemal [Echinococcus granulosus]KAH9277890.1 Dynein light chain 4, axonemal [Echinococcus granulosus]CDS20602.1 dynein light chain [Echinococcus granulosus]